MTSSNKARRYLQHKQNLTDSQNNHQSAAELLVIDPTLAVTNMRKFRGRAQQSPSVPIPQICVDDDDNDDDDDLPTKSPDDENGHVAILNEFDQVLENELKRTSVLRTSSLKQKESNEQITIPINQQRSFSFALGSSTKLEGKKHDDDDNDDEPINASSSSPSKSSKLPSTIKASLSKEKFSRFLHSLAFRSGNHTTSKVAMTSATLTESPSQRPCLACQSHSNLDLMPKYKKRPSIFGVLVSKLNTNTTIMATSTSIANDVDSTRCSVCKRHLSKSIFYNTITTNIDDENHQLTATTTKNLPSSSSSFASTKILQDQSHPQILLRTKRRRSLPSLFHSLFDFDHHDKHHLDATHTHHHRPSFSSILTHTLLDSITREQQQQQQQPTSIPMIKQTSSASISSLSMAESEESEENNIDKSFKRQSVTYDDSSQLTEKLQVRLDTDGTDEIKAEHENKTDLLESQVNDADEMNMNETSTSENCTNQLFLHPPEEKTRSLLVNVFRTRRSNVALGSNETSMVGKQFSVSVINLATAINSNRLPANQSINSDSNFLNLKHALSEENLTSTDGTYIYFHNINGQSFKEKLKYSSLAENTTLREFLLKLFEKHHLTIDTCNICLRSAPTLPLSLDQPVKQLLLDDLIVTEKELGLPSCSRMNNRALAKTSAGKERHEKRNSTGSAVFSTTSKSASATSKRLSSQCMVSDNDDILPSNNPSQQEIKTSHGRSNKTSRSGLFTGSIFTRDGTEERPESNLAFVRRKCDEWLARGLPKLAQLQNHQILIDEQNLKIEKEWQPFLNDQAKSIMSESIKLQQEAIYEMLSTEVSYIRQILTMIEIFMTSMMILKSSQRDGLLNDIDMEKLFSNIQDVLNANLLFWKEVLLPVKLKLEQTGCAMNPSELKIGFLKFDVYFKSYIHYVLDQKTSAEYFKQKLAKDDLFQYLITWIEANFTNRLSFPDLTIKPLQRLTQYKLLLEAIQKRTQDNQQRNDLSEMIQKVAMFVNRVNSKLHSQEQEERVRQIGERIGPFENISAPPELTSILQEYNRDLYSHRLDLLRDMPLFVRGYRRQIIQQGPMKMKDSKNSQDVYCYLFTDMFLITKIGKRSGTTNSSTNPSSSSISITNDGQFNRNLSGTIHKILKSPIRIDRMDVKEYDRRGGSSSSSSSNEPNIASFVAIVFSEYNLIECGYLFQTNLSKQWIENIRTAKTNFQLLLEESKTKLQNAHNPSTNPTTNTTSSSTNTMLNVNIHQSLPSLSSTSEISIDSAHKLQLDGTSLDSSSTDEPILQCNSLESSQRSLKIESDSTKIVETRRNSRSDPKNFGRYFTADGTSTHTTNPSSSSINPSTTKSSDIKRLSWTNEPTTNTDLTTNIPTNELSNTNSFRSVHSSSGVSSTGSSLFSGDEESLGTTTPSSMPMHLLSSSSSTTSNTKTEDLTDELDEVDGKSSSSTVIGTDDHEHSINLQTSTDLFNNENNRLSTASTSTLTSTSINESNNATVQTQNSSPETLLRRTPFASVKKRHPNQLIHRSGLAQLQQTTSSSSSSSSSSSRRHRIFDENDLRSSTHTVVYDSSKTSSSTTTAIPIRRTALTSDDNNHNTSTNLTLSSFTGSGNESDYDNNQTINDYSKSLSSTMKFPSNPVNDLHPDDLLLGDQNEIVLNNNHSDFHRTFSDEHLNMKSKVEDVLHSNDQQSDNHHPLTSATSLQSTANHRMAVKQTSNSSLDDSAPPNYLAYRKDPVTAKKLLDIRSHLLLNTTLDATEV